MSAPHLVFTLSTQDDVRPCKAALPPQLLITSPSCYRASAWPAVGRRFCDPPPHVQLMCWDRSQGSTTFSILSKVVTKDVDDR